MDGEVVVAAMMKGPGYSLAPPPGLLCASFRNVRPQSFNLTFVVLPLCECVPLLPSSHNSSLCNVVPPEIELNCEEW